MALCRNMISVSHAVTPKEMAIAADYFSRLKLTKWIRVVETDRVPTTKIAGGMLVVEGNETEPIGSRVVEVPEDLGCVPGRRRKSCTFSQ